MKSWIPLLFAFVSAVPVSADEPAPCVFCEIAESKRPAAIVYRDEFVVAFMDHAPVNPGHVLVIPLVHSENYLEAAPETVAHMARIAQRVGAALRQTDLRAEGIRVTMNTGAAAGQSVFHTHLHVIPRFAGDGKDHPEKIVAPLEELETVAAKIRRPMAVKDPVGSAPADAKTEPECMLKRLVRVLGPRPDRDFVREYESTEIGFTWDEDDERFMDFKFSAMFPLLALNHAAYPVAPHMNVSTGKPFPDQGVRIRDFKYGQSTLFMSGTIRAGQYIKTRPSSPVVGKRFNPQIFLRSWALDEKDIAVSDRKYLDLILFGHESNGQSVTTEQAYLDQWEIYRNLEKDPHSPAAKENARLGARDSISRGWDYVGAEWGWSWGTDPIRGVSSNEPSRQMRIKARHFLPVGPAQGAAENYNDWEEDGPRFRRRHYDGLMIQYAATGNPFLKWTQFFTGRYSVTYTTGLSQPFHYSTVEVEAAAKIRSLPLAAWFRYGYNGDLVDYYRHGTSYGFRIAIWEY